MPKQRIWGQNVVKWPEVGAKTRASPKCRDVQELASKTARETLRNPGTVSSQGFCRESGYSCLLVEERNPLAEHAVENSLGPKD